MLTATRGGSPRGRQVAPPAAFRARAKSRFQIARRFSQSFAIMRRTRRGHGLLDRKSLDDSFRIARLRNIRINYELNHEWEQLCCEIWVGAAEIVSQNRILTARLFSRRRCRARRSRRSRENEPCAHVRERRKIACEPASQRNKCRANVRIYVPPRLSRDSFNCSDRAVSLAPKLRKWLRESSYAWNAFRLISTMRPNFLRYALNLTRSDRASNLPFRHSD